MKTREIPLPLLGAIAATRGMMGFGAGLLLSDHVPPSRRHKVGWALFAFGAASTIPLAAIVFRKT